MKVNISGKGTIPDLNIPAPAYDKDVTLRQVLRLLNYFKYFRVYGPTGLITKDNVYKVFQEFGSGSNASATTSLKYDKGMPLQVGQLIYNEAGQLFQVINSYTTSSKPGITADEAFENDVKNGNLKPVGNTNVTVLENNITKLKQNLDDVKTELSETITNLDENKLGKGDMIEVSLV